MAMLILMFFMPGSFRNCDPKHQQGRWLWWTMPAFTSVMICWKRSAPISVRQSFFHLTAPTLTPLNTNGLKPQPSEGDTGVLLMNSFLSIHNMSFYNDLAIPLGNTCLASIPKTPFHLQVFLFAVPNNITLRSYLPSSEPTHIFCLIKHWNCTENRPFPHKSLRIVYMKKLGLS